MLVPGVKLSRNQRSLLANYSKLEQSDRASLLAFAEFLVDRSNKNDRRETVPREPAKPKPIPRPEEETVIGAIKRLSETFYMIDRKDLLTETSSLMSAHIMHGRAASEVIDELETLFVTQYKRHNSDGD